MKIVAALSSITGREAMSALSVSAWTGIARISAALFSLTGGGAIGTTATSSTASVLASAALASVTGRGAISTFSASAWAGIARISAAPSSVTGGGPTGTTVI